MITADELRSRAAKEAVVRITDEEAEHIAWRLEYLEECVCKFATTSESYRDALYRISSLTTSATIKSIADEALGYI